MNRTFFSFLLCISQVWAQSTALFSSDPQQFVKDLDAFMNLNRLADCKEASDEFQKAIKEGLITEQQLKYISATANVMREKNFPASPQFVNYLSAIVAFARSGRPENIFNEWDEVCDQMLRNLKRGENASYTRFLEFSKIYFEQNLLHKTQNKAWKVDATDCKLEYAEGRPRLKIPPTRFYGFISSDTIQIYNTQGYYYPVENKFEGKGGRADWKRSSQDPNKVFVNFKSYSVDLNSYGYTIDSSVFTNSYYLKRVLLGRFTDKLIPNNDTTKSDYPRFESYETDIVLTQVAPNVNYFGGFNFWGTKVVGYNSNGESAGFDFFARDGKTLVMRVRSKDILIIRDKELGATNAEVLIFFGKDSIYHPSVNLNYKVDKREMRLFRGENALGRSRFIDSYHQFEFETDALIWNLDSTRLQLKILSGIGKNAANFESTDYFNKDRIRQIQGVSSYEPLALIYQVQKQMGTDEIAAADIAKKIDPKLTEVQIKSLLYKLVENGFIIYNEKTGMVRLREKLAKYVLANAKKVDYDYLRMRSIAPDGVDYLDLKSADMQLRGVGLIPVSDTANVTFFPSKKTVNLQKNRNMQFDGTIIAGRIDIAGKENKFVYDTFVVNMPQVDSLMMYIPDGDRLNEEGKPVLKPLRSKLENLSARLEIDAPINKSGRSRLYQFPRITTRGSSYVYYEDSSANKGAYSKKDFFFQVEPFQLDSLNNLEPSVLDFKGKLVSGGIFPDIAENLKLQDDLSLGFKTETPPNGYPLFKDKGNYKGKIALDFKGLQGEGVITHSTAAFTSSGIRFYPDSVLALTDSFTIAATDKGVMTPDVQSAKVNIFWKSKADSMYAQMTETPFAMYGKSTQLKGDLLLTKQGLFGSGTLDWNEANLISKGFYFKTRNLGADTAELKIKTPDGNNIAFLSPNVKAKVDFEIREGNFSNNLKGVPTEFAYNQYNTFIPNFRWDIDKHILEFKSPEGSRGEQFNSLNKAQKGLNFIAKRATYDLLNSILTVEQIPEIIVADSRVIPDSGKVIIEADAKMRTLTNATIISDTISGTHKISKATIDIISKAELKGSGEYKYSTLNTPEQTIVFDDISVKKTTTGKKGKDEEFHLASKGPIPEDANFILYPNVNFAGEASMYSQNPYLIFKGIARINYKTTRMEPAEFYFEDTVNPKQFLIHYKAETKDATGTPVIAGISCAKNAEQIHLYTNLLNIKENLTDPTILKAEGIVFHDAKKNEYAFGDKAKILDGALKGNVIRFNDEKAIVTAEGEFDPVIKLVAPLKVRMVGDVENDLNKGSFVFNVTLGIDLRTTKEIDDKLARFLHDDNLDLNDIYYESARAKKQFYQLCDEKKDDATIKEFERTATFKRPKDFIHHLVFTNVNLVFDKEDGTLRSTGKIGLVMVGEKPINKQIDGSIEISFVPGDEHIYIYLRCATGEWFFLEYKNGVYGILSSYEVFTTQIGALMAAGKNIVKDEKGNSFYRFVIGSAANQSDFVERMREKKLAAGEKVDDAPRPRPKTAPAPATPTDEQENLTPETLPAKKKKQSEAEAENPPAPPAEPAKPTGRRQKYSRELQQNESETMPSEPTPSTSTPSQNAPAEPIPENTKPKEEPKPTGRRQKYSREIQQENEVNPPSDSTPPNYSPPPAPTQETNPPVDDGVKIEDVPPDNAKKKKKKSKDTTEETPE
jgi:hypothetical protein